ncbi:MAG: acetyl-CoA carboxylase biotin carboxyl carrier protein subunit [Chitinophagaceae bacterium]|nr:acetyl-CoA carboxylase biotin carboxyl carrier protein subunit [Chitinophagaceae bacterium]
MSNSNKVFKVKANDFEFTIDNAALNAADFIKKSPTDFNLIKNNRSVNARLIETDMPGKFLQIEVEGEIFNIEIKDELDQMLDQMGFNSASTKHIKEVKAPMPGLVLEVNVTQGQEVKEGDRLLILSAMKMENSILIHADAKIKNIKVSAGQAVDKGQVLVELE